MGRRIYSLDAVKVLAFCGIVCIHGLYSYDDFWSKSLVFLGRFGVPFFFAVSGFFSFRATAAKFLLKMRHIGIIIVGGLSFYLLMGLLGLWMPATDIVYSISSKEDFVRFIFTNNYSPGSYHLWFLFCAFYVYGLFWILTRFKVRLRMLYMFAVLVVIARLFLCQVMLVPYNSAWLRDWLFFGFPCFTLGLFCRSWLDDHRVLLSSPWLFVGVLAGFCLSAIEYKVLGRQELYLGTLISVGCTIFLCTLLKTQRKGVLSWLGGQPIMVAYVVHLFLIEIVSASMYAAMLRPVGVCIISIVGSLLVGSIFVFVKEKFHVKNEKAKQFESDSVPNALH